MDHSRSEHEPFLRLLFSKTKPFWKKYKQLKFETLFSRPFAADYAELLEDYVKQTSGKQLSVGFVQDITSGSEYQVKMVFHLQTRSGSMDGLRGLLEVMKRRANGGDDKEVQTIFTESDWFTDLRSVGTCVKEGDIEANRTDDEKKANNEDGINPIETLLFDWCPVQSAGTGGDGGESMVSEPKITKLDVDNLANASDDYVPSPSVKCQNDNQESACLEPQSYATQKNLPGIFEPAVKIENEVQGSSSRNLTTGMYVFSIPFDAIGPSQNINVKYVFSWYPMRLKK